MQGGIVLPVASCKYPHYRSNPDRNRPNIMLGVMSLWSILEILCMASR